MSKDLKEIAPATFELPREEGMKVPGLVIITRKLMEEMDLEKPLGQVRNVAHLPGIVGHSIAMPDIHWGYGFPIGGVAATDPIEGVISPGGVGYDINCGVRLAVIPLPLSELSLEKKQEFIDRIFQYVPSGVGHGHRGQKLTDSEYDMLLKKGAKWSIEQGFGFEKDLEHIESHGMIERADPSAISSQAKNRGRNQLGSIGSGNHFVEVGEIDEIYLPDIASAWGIEKEHIYLLIHSGSRGFGHQVCQDTLDSFLEQGYAKGLPDRQLVAAPVKSAAGQKYFAAMAGAANYAFNNRQQILHYVRKAAREVLGAKEEEVRLIYDVCHNIAKFETHEVDGKPKELCVHRKGATRAYGPGSAELMPLFKQTGQPVLVPGDMARASHIMVGLGSPLTWCSSCHGAGRARSRVQSLKSWKGRDLIKHMASEGIQVRASSGRTVAEEMPDAYKDVDLVVKAVEDAKLASRVAKLKPAMVVKG